MNIVEIIPQVFLMHQQHIHIVFVVALLRCLRKSHVGGRCCFVVEGPKNRLIVDCVAGKKAFPTHFSPCTHSCNLSSNVSRFQGAFSADLLPEAADVFSFIISTGFSPREHSGHCCTTVLCKLLRMSISLRGCSLRSCPTHRRAASSCTWACSCR